MNEKDFMNQIKNMSDDIEIPASLEPDAIQKMLEEKSDNKVIQMKKKKHRKKVGATLAAACVVLACTAGYRAGQQFFAPLTPTTVKTEEKEEVRATGIEAAGSYKEIYDCLEQYEMVVYDAVYLEEDAMESDASEDTGKAVEESGDYSTTNVRQEGVDEADVVKTDGRYIYTLRDSGMAVSIIDTKDHVMKNVGEVSLADGYYIQELYITDNKLILVADKEINNQKEGAAYVNRSNTAVLTYDLTNIEKPKKIGEVEASGLYKSSRLVDGYVYLFSEFSLGYGVEYSEKDLDMYVPMINGDVLSEKNIYMPQYDQAYMYEVITAVDITDPGVATDSKAILSDGGQLYVSNHNIYWYERDWNTYQKTKIRKLSYKDGRLKATAFGQVSGYIHDSFCIDEYDGYLRIITTDNDANNVFVLDENLKLVGEIRNLAHDERVYSARLMGEVGYFVTYRETDPLFSVDFSNPRDPRIVGQLKIPGFSEYLHFYGEGKLVGIGMDTELDGRVSNGIKLSMFDIRDISNVSEVDKYVMENVYSADVMYDYKAALIDVDKNIIGFSAQDATGEKYYVFSYDEEQGFVCQMEELVNGNGYLAARGLYIDDELYVVKGNIIEGYSIPDFEKIDDIIL